MSERLAGVKAYGSASPGKHGLVAELGAIPIDYKAGPVDDLVRAYEPAGVDVVFDAIGGAGIRHCLRALRKGGTIVGYGFMAVKSKFAMARMFWDIFVGARWRGRRGSFYGISLRYRKDPKPFHEDQPKIFALLAQRKIEPVISATLPLADARKALELLATGTVAGKIVLVCDGASAFAEDAAKQLGGVLHADLLHDVGPVTLDGARA